LIRGLQVAAATLTVTGALAACGGSDRATIPQSGPTAETEFGVARPYGHGPGQAWVLTPKAGKPRSVVVFMHGWTATSPFEWHQSWLDHLLAGGNAVVFPVYQTSGDEGELVTARIDLRNGLRTAFRALREDDLPVVVVGYSVGAALAFYYAADAAGWGVPRPAAVYGIFPVDPMRMDPGLLHLGPPARVPTLILVGDRDDTVGGIGADTFWKWLDPVPRTLKAYRLLHSDPDGLWFDHESVPASEFSLGLRRVFWRPLDELVAKVR
jgi:acetyl esterase/lipase